MTPHTLAIVILVTVIFSLLPGSAFKRRPEIDWERPNIYVSFVQTAALLWLLWDLLS